MRLPKFTRRVALWVSERRTTKSPRPTLEPVRRRIELLLGALYDVPVTLEPARKTKRRDVLVRFARLGPRYLLADAPLATTDGATIRLAPVLDVPNEEDALARYRLLALEQAERVARGTAALVPDDSPLERDLYLLCESAAVDATLATRLHTVAPTLAEARASALASRPPVRAMTSAERAVESMVRATLGDDASGTRPPVTTSPVESRRWARETARRIDAETRGARYAGVWPVPLWGETKGGPHVPYEELDSWSVDGSFFRQRSEAGGARGNESPESGESMSEQHGGDEGEVEAMRAASGAGVADQQRRGASTAQDTHDPLGPMDVMPRHGAPADGTVIVRTDYDEWDAYTSRYRPRAVTVHQWAAVEDDDESHAAWAHDALRDNAALVRRVRERFGRLRAQRVRLMRQRDGEELDLAACVRALVDSRLGHAVDERLYTSVRPARRGLAIALLVDASGSTDAPVVGTRQVIDVEKTAALLAAEALDALGDPYAVLAFSSRGARHVWMRVVKDFAERNGESTRRRLASLVPEANTRLGAAMRHATTLLTRQPAGHRLLLVVSDGRPNDIDHYQERFAVEDARQAVAEARAAGVHPFCLTVDREQPDYLPRIFGATGYTIMRQPDHLPAALLGAVKTLLGG